MGDSCISSSGIVHSRDWLLSILLYLAFYKCILCHKKGSVCLNENIAKISNKSSVTCNNFKNEYLFLELVLTKDDIKIFCNFVTSMMIFFGPIFW